MVVVGLLAVGQALSGFFADRLWEASISDAAAMAGSRRAWLELLLEIGIVVLTVCWLTVHWGLALRIALPRRAAPGEDEARIWPRAVPRWSVPVAAILAGLLLGSGGSRLIGSFQLYLDGAPIGIRDPLLDEDLGTFLGSFPFWSAIQARAAMLSLVALAGVVCLYALGGRIDRVGRRIRVSPTARGQVAVLVALLALCLAWGASLEPLRLASGQRGPVLHSEFVLRAVMAYIGTGLGAAAAVVSLLSWVRVRGGVALLLWVMFGLVWIGGELLPLHPEHARQDALWRAEARRIDSVAFGIANLAGALLHPRPMPAALPASLWDDSLAIRAGLGFPAQRAWVSPRGALDAVPVWLGSEGGAPSTILALADDRVSPSGAPVFWTSEGSEPSPASQEYWPPEPGALLTPQAERRVMLIDDSLGPGVRISNLPRRILLAWAWQFPGALSAPAGRRVTIRLDPAIRLSALAPFAHWSAPHLRRAGSRLLWQSDGLLTAPGLPSSQRVPWGTGEASLVTSGLLGLVDAESGEVRIYQRDPADSLASAWARIAHPLIESPGKIPPELQVGEAYPPELAMAQSRVLTGPAWLVGNLDPVQGLTALESPGGNRRVVPFVRPGTRLLAALLVLERMPSGDSLRLVPLDSLPPLESAGALVQKWERFPFQQMLRDSVLAAGAAFRPGMVRYEMSADGPVAYQPAWAEGPAARPRLVLVNVALGSRLGTGRSFEDAWRNLRGEMSPAPVGPESREMLDQVRRWWQRADSALRRGDLDALRRQLSQLRDLLERQP